MQALPALTYAAKAQDWDAAIMWPDIVVILMVAFYVAMTAWGVLHDLREHSLAKRTGQLHNYTHTAYECVLGAVMLAALSTYFVYATKTVDPDVMRTR